ncbi:dienelactone hydrolase family protein [Oceanimonas pelagia]|uniref:Dienelactone hydrolase family protein n=1 Tax=Oceanimonas pelagia TaxID=3028314 RepID=A0AA50KQ21_9GAMM|nr:dienelactone hydrolase family protein [Oceanimonas pelagia]WMC12286.1 dienelactone hydrolase family protein [Oceanimonas pelagia]
MSRPNSPRIPSAAFGLYDRYAHGQIDRRQFMSGLARLAVGGLTATALFEALMPDYAQAQQVSFTDPAIRARYLVFDSPDGHGQGRGYRVEPTGEVLGRVLVVHENRGLNPYIEDVARRLAKAGFVAFAPDALASLGGYPGNDDDGRALQQQLETDNILADFTAAARLLDQPGQGIGVIGFCFGGFVANTLAARLPESVRAAVPFYGLPPDLSRVSDIKGALLIQLAEQDERVNSAWPAYREALQAGGIEFEMHQYAGTQHGFHNDSTPRYHPEAAELAWSRTLAFLRTRLTA